MAPASLDRRGRGIPASVESAADSHGDKANRHEVGSGRSFSQKPLAVVDVEEGKLGGEHVEAHGAGQHHYGLHHRRHGAELCQPLVRGHLVMTRWKGVARRA